MFECMDRESLKRRIIKKSKESSETGCWIWLGSKNSEGYGNIGIGSRSDRTRKTAKAHRVSYFAFYDVDPKNLDVCHKCDNPSCVNPQHLFLGTAKDNVQDMIKKGRFHIPDSATSNFAKLTPKRVWLAKEIREECGVSYEQIASLFGVKKNAIRLACVGETWKTLDRRKPKQED